MKREKFEKELDIYNKNYSDLTNKINILRADGDLDKLCKLKTTFDETFDSFFDEIREKYIDYELLGIYDEGTNEYDNNKEELIKNMSNNDMLENMDENDMERYIEFFKNYLAELEDELSELEN